jgi:hypothetical protein
VSTQEEKAPDISVPVRNNIGLAKPQTTQAANSPKNKAQK